MEPKIVKDTTLNEYFTSEQCFIAENFRSPEVSVARARVAPGVTTVAHHLEGIDEMYLITSGTGKVEFSNLKPTQVSAGDLIVIPAGASQRITNIGKTDLVFYCICTPSFNEKAYVDDERK